MPDGPVLCQPRPHPTRSSTVEWGPTYICTPPVFAPPCPADSPSPAHRERGLGVRASSASVPRRTTMTTNREPAEAEPSVAGPQAEAAVTSVEAAVPAGPYAAPMPPILSDEQRQLFV